MAGAVTETEVKGKGWSPAGITSGPDGAIWFAQYREIGRLTVRGDLSLYALPGGDDGAQDICVGSDGNLWFTVSHGYSRD